MTDYFNALKALGTDENGKAVALKMEDTGEKTPDGRRIMKLSVDTEMGSITIGSVQVKDPDGTLIDPRVIASSDKTKPPVKLNTVDPVSFNHPAEGSSPVPIGMSIKPDNFIDEKIGFSLPDDSTLRIGEIDTANMPRITGYLTHDFTSGTLKVFSSTDYFPSFEDKDLAIDLDKDENPDIKIDFHAIGECTAIEIHNSSGATKNYSLFLIQRAM